MLAGEINPNINNNEKRRMENYAIFIDPNDIVKTEEQDYDSLFNNQIYNGRFYIKNVVDSSEPDILIQEENEKEIFISEETMDLIKKGKGLAYFKDMDDDFKIFEVVIKFMVTIYSNVYKKLH